MDPGSSPQAGALVSSHLLRPCRLKVTFTAPGPLAWCPCGLPWPLLQGLGSLLSWAGGQPSHTPPRGRCCSCLLVSPPSAGGEAAVLPDEPGSGFWLADRSCLLLGVAVTRSSGRPRRAVSRAFRGGPGVRTVLFHCRGLDPIPDRGAKILRTAQCGLHT